MTKIGEPTSVYRTPSERDEYIESLKVLSIKLPEISAELEGCRIQWHLHDLYRTIMNSQNIK